MASLSKRPRYSKNKNENEVASSAMYNVGSMIFCKWNGTFYEAKIKRVEQRNGIFFYKIHYHGWSATYDEVIPQDVAKKRFRDYDSTPGALERLNEEESQEEAISPAKQRSPRVALSTLPTPNSFISAKPSSFEDLLPATLASILNFDHNATKQGKLHKLPAAYTVGKIIDEYKKVISDTYAKSITSVNAVFLLLSADAILEAFDKSVRKLLLYEEEWAFYDSAKKDVHPFVPSSFYGFVHIIRFCTKSEQIVDKMELRRELHDPIRVNIKEFVEYLSNKSEQYYDFEKDYQ